MDRLDGFARKVGSEDDRLDGFKVFRAFLGVHLGCQVNREVFGVCGQNTCGNVSGVAFGNRGHVDCVVSRIG